MTNINKAKIHSISISDKKGMRKTNVDSAELVVNHGIKTDAHAGDWHRQISLLAQESIDKMVEKGLDVKSGNFAENITTSDIDLMTLEIGSKVSLGSTELIISQLGKVCHHRCVIYHQAGDCVMPREGIFGVVTKGGHIKVGDPITTEPKKGLSVGIITLSDRAAQGVRGDLTGPAIEEAIRKEINCSFIRREVIADEQKTLEMHLVDFADTQKFDLIITNGSTGVSPRDIAPEALHAVIERRLPGFEEAMRAESFKKTPFAIVSRAVCGIRKNSLIISLPGSPKGAIENLAVVIKAIEHTVLKIQGDPTDCAK